MFKLPPRLSKIASIAVVVAGSSFAQQANGTLAALSVNGTGQVDPTTGLVVPTSSQISPAPPGGAPLYRHRNQAGASLELRMQGPPGAPVILVAGTPQPPQNVGIGFVEISIPTMTVLLDGTAPFGGLLNATAFVGPSGSWTLTAGSGLPPGTPNVHMQGVVVDPTAPLGIRLTGSITVETRNDLETLSRNFVDAFDHAQTNPLYGASLATPNFLWNGLSRQALFAFGGLEPVSFVGLHPNATNAPPLPAAGPTPGQSVVFALETDTALETPCPGFSAFERNRDYELTASESLGVWKYAGVQRDAEVEVTLQHVGPAPDVYVQFHVTDDAGQRGGIASVTVSGPQLSGVNLGTLFATSSASGGFSLPANDPSEWSVAIRLAASGTSRLPLVENAAGPRDVYQVTIFWNDSSTSGPYSIPLRAAIDVDLSPAAAVAAAPGAGSPSGVLSNPGTPGASLALTFAVGSTPSPAIWTSLSLRTDQSPSGGAHEFERLVVPTSPSTQTLSLCVPGMVSGVATNLYFEREDVFGARYARVAVATF